MAAHLDLGSEVGDKQTGDLHEGCGVGKSQALDEEKNIEHDVRLSRDIGARPVLSLVTLRYTTWRVSGVFEGLARS